MSNIFHCFRFFAFCGILSVTQSLASQCENTMCSSLRVGVGTPLYQTFLGKEANIENSGGYVTLSGRLAKHRILAELNGLIGIGKTKLKNSYFTDKNLKSETNSATLEGDIKLGINITNMKTPIFFAGVYGAESFSIHSGGIFSTYFLADKENQQSLVMTWHYAGAEVIGQMMINTSSKIEYLLGYYSILNSKSSYRFKKEDVVSHFAGSNYMLKASLGFISSGYYVKGIYKYQNFAASEIKNNLNYPTTQNHQFLLEVGLEF